MYQIVSQDDSQCEKNTTSVILKTGENALTNPNKPLQLTVQFKLFRANQIYKVVIPSSC